MLAIVAASACDAGTRGDGAVAFLPPAVYARWWALTESCSGLSGSLRSVRWMRAPARALQAAEGAGTVAFWSSRDNRIVLAMNAVTNGRIVRHEMLHALARSRGHPVSLFRNQCEGVVRCDEACAGDAAVPRQMSTAVPVPVDGLAIDVMVYPTMPSPTVDDGAFQIIVTVTNPASHAVRVGFRAPDPAIAISVAPGDERLTADHEIGNPRVAAFGPGERKQYVFDLWAGDPASRVAFRDGEYRVTGHFDALSTAPWTFRVGLTGRSSAPLIRDQPR